MLEEKLWEKISPSAGWLNASGETWYGTQKNTYYERQF
jgi:hypothetical protein